MVNLIRASKKIQISYDFEIELFQEAVFMHAKILYSDYPVGYTMNAVF